MLRWKNNRRKQWINNNKKAISIHIMKMSFLKTLKVNTDITTVMNNMNIILTGLVMFKAKQSSGKHGENISPERRNVLRERKTVQEIKAVNINGQSYISLNVIADAFCLDKSFVEDLVMTKDIKGNVEIVNDKVMVPFDVFKRIKFPQDEYFFQIVAAYYKSKLQRKGERQNG